MRVKEYRKEDDGGNYVKAYLVNEGWEIEINCQGKALKYGSSNCNRIFWNSRKQAADVVDNIFLQGIAAVYKEEHKRQFGY